jgi:SpoVK/Ycf46/Vps4 family AAA+-type ATPase
MYNKKKTMTDPMKINNYNKFLLTLDQKYNTGIRSSVINTKNNIEDTKNNIEDTKNNIEDTKNNIEDIKNNIEDTKTNIEDIKNNIENILDSKKNIEKLDSFYKIGNKTNNTEDTNNINDIKVKIDKNIENYMDIYKKNYSSVNFTGKNPNNKIEFLDPNYYNDITRTKFEHLKRNESVKSEEHEKIEPKIEIKQTIIIESEINSISDIFKLIETYQLDPSIKYNINMKALHDIKEPLEELNNMIGMKDLKNNIVDQILYFAQELHKNNLTTCDFMHTVIYGPSGTGKTEIAKIIGKIYSKIGVLSKGTFKKVTRSDLIAGYLGQTALKTRDAIKDALGGVLFIDEAYALGNPEKKDSFSKECIDTLCEALSDHKENLMVIIAGYEKELKECFFNLNQGLDSRFNWRFKTDEYSAEDLYNIFLKKVKDIGWEIAENSRISVEWFKKNKEYFKFYGRDIETILAKTKIAHSRRVFCKADFEKRKIILQDLDKGLEIYLKNEDVQNRRDKIEMNKYLQNTLYT